MWRFDDVASPRRSLQSGARDDGGPARRSGAAAAIAVCLAVLAPWTSVVAGGQDGDLGGEPTSDTVAALVQRLGDPDFQRREAAAAELQALGPAAVDALLVAAEVEGDLEVALRARWIVDTIPLEMAHDSAEVGRLLESYDRRDLDQRRRVMLRLLRTEDDGGMEALARLVRLERSPEAARIAASLLAREWSPGDRWWPRTAERVVAGVGRSGRPPATFLRALVEYTTVTDPAARSAALDAAGAALAVMARSSAAEDGPEAVGDLDPDTLPGTSGGGEASMRLLGRIFVRMLCDGDRRDAGVAEARRQFEADLRGEPGRTQSLVIDWLTWGVEAGLPEIVDVVHESRQDLIAADPTVASMAAVAHRARGDAARAASLADEAFALHQRLVARAPDRSTRLSSAYLLSREGCDEWAIRLYTAILDDPRSVPREYVLAAIFGSEYLHEMDRDAEAAAMLERLFAPDTARRGFDVDQTITETSREPRSVRARMHFFSACAAAARGDVADSRRRLEDALREDSKEIDSLIALFRLPDNTPDQTGDARRRVNEALRRIENEIHSVPDEPNASNEWAWLVANTEGDAEKATRYSRQSLVKAFDNSSYLDTLAHCRAAAGDLDGAVRWQTLALRQSPHNHTIRKSLERFERLAAAAAERAP